MLRFKGYYPAALVGIRVVRTLWVESNRIGGTMVELPESFSALVKGQIQLLALFPAVALD